MLRKSSCLFYYYSNNNNNPKATSATGSQRNTLGGEQGGAADYFTFTSRTAVDIARQAGQGRGISPTHDYYSKQPETPTSVQPPHKKNRGGQQTVEELHDVLNSFRTPTPPPYHQSSRSAANVAGELEATKPSLLQQIKSKTTSVSSFLARAARGKKIVECWCGFRFETEVWKEWLVCPMSYCEAPGCPNRDYFVSGEGRRMMESGQIQSGAPMKTVKSLTASSSSSDTNKKK